ncbi:MAG: PEGA domain-containing protein [Candidatus Eremiobacteraeota bacterium]|nr:PEGA domain-containing protein [Candidatus Eremiobacteraeota bacterium]
MLRRLAAVAACVVLPAAVATGSLYVTTLPTAAEVWVDGVYVGRTPLVLDALATGRHTVNLTKSGWSARQLDVTILAWQTSVSSVRLDPSASVPRSALPGAIALHGNVPLRLRLDGLPAVARPDGTLSAAPGRHELTIMTPRGRVTRTVTVWPQTRTDVMLVPDNEPAKPSVVAPADDYLRPGDVRVEGEKIVVRSGGHQVVGRFGSTAYRVDGRVATYDAAPTRIGSRLYLPIDLLTILNAERDR